MKRGKEARKQPLSRKAKIIGVVAGAVLVWQISMISLAAGHSDSNNDLAAADFAGASQAAAIAAAEQRLSANDFAGAKVFATQALSISAISAASLRDLGLAEQGLGNWRRSGVLFSQNAALGWQDGPTQLWLAQAYLQQKDDESAAQRIDAALRVAPQSTTLVDMLDPQIADPDLTNAMIERLQLNPNWRTHYFRYLNNAPLPALVARSRMLIALASSSTPPSRDEIIPLLYSLVQADRTKLARLVWERSQHVTIGGIYDPGFQQTGVTGMAPFEWSILPVPGASVTVASQGTGNILSATTDGAASGTLLRQITALPPGSHSLTYDGTIPTAAHNAFGWRIRCISGGKDLVNSVRDTADPPYHFDVPSTCGGQRVELLVSSSAAAAGSQVSFKKVDIN
ncbi:hypothetical protein [Sphingomonas oryzagri]